MCSQLHGVKMSERLEPKNSAAIRILLGLVAPLVLATLVFLADIVEGPRTAFVGIATSLPLMAAIFGSPRITIFVGVNVLAGTVFHGMTTTDGTDVTQLMRLGFVALSVGLAITYSYVRTRQQRERTQLFLERLELQETSRLALHDQLTEIFNRHGVLDRLQTDSRWPRTVVLFDLDKLKNINDTYGHVSGDEAIRTVAERLQRSIAPGDILGRWGGDEFIVIFPLHVDQALSVTQRVLSRVTEEPVFIGGSTFYPHASAGLAEWHPTSTLEHSVALADEALYRAKNLGGNVAIATESSLA